MADIALPKCISPVFVFLAERLFYVGMCFIHSVFSESWSFAEFHCRGRALKINVIKLFLIKFHLRSTHNMQIYQSTTNYFRYSKNCFSKWHAFRKPNSNLKFQLNLAMHVGENCKKMDGLMEGRTETEWRHSNKICSTLNFQLNISKHVTEKCWKLCKTAYFLYSKFEKRHNFSKIDAKWRHSHFICSTFKQSHMKNFSSIFQNM